MVPVHALGDVADIHPDAQVHPDAVDSHRRRGERSRAELRCPEA